MGFRFRNDSNEEACDKPILGIRAAYACMRTAGHESPCVAMARHAGLADRLCFSCRLPFGHHRDECDCERFDQERERMEFFQRIRHVEKAMEMLQDSEVMSLQNTYGEILRLLSTRAGETGENEGAIDVVKRLMRERDEAERLKNLDVALREHVEEAIDGPTYLHDLKRLGAWTSLAESLADSLGEARRSEHKLKERVRELEDKLNRGNI